MSLLTFLPCLTSWGSDQKQNRELESELEESEDVTEAQTQKQDLFGYQMRYEITRSPQKRKTRRKISYWSDDEAVAIKSSR